MIPEWPHTPTVTALLHQIVRRPDEFDLKLVLADACQDVGAPEDFCTGVRALGIYEVVPYFSYWGGGITVYGIWVDSSTSVNHGTSRNEWEKEIGCAMIPDLWWRCLVLQDYLNLAAGLRMWKRIERAYFQLAVAFTLLAPEHQSAILTADPQKRVDALLSTRYNK